MFAFLVNGINRIKGLFGPSPRKEPEDDKEEEQNVGEKRKTHVSRQSPEDMKAKLGAFKDYKSLKKSKFATKEEQAVKLALHIAEHPKQLLKAASSGGLHIVGGDKFHIPSEPSVPAMRCVDDTGKGRCMVALKAFKEGAVIANGIVAKANREYKKEAAKQLDAASSLHDRTLYQYGYGNSNFMVPAFGPCTVLDSQGNFIQHPANTTSIFETADEKADANIKIVVTKQPYPLPLVDEFTQVFDTYVANVEAIKDIAEGAPLAIHYGTSMVKKVQASDLALAAFEKACDAYKISSCRASWYRCPNYEECGSTFKQIKLLQGHLFNRGEKGDICYKPFGKLGLELFKQAKKADRATRKAQKAEKSSKKSHKRK